MSQGEGTRGEGKIGTLGPAGASLVHQWHQVKHKTPVGDPSSEPVPEAAIEGRGGKRGESVESSIVNLEREWSGIELGLNPGWTTTGYKTQASGLTSLFHSTVYEKGMIMSIFQGRVRIKWMRCIKLLAQAEAA